MKSLKAKNGFESISPKSSVFILFHVHEFEDGHEDVKIIGVYSTEERARQARERVKDQPGFRDHPECFEISEHQVDGRDDWPEGYVTLQPGEE